MISLDYYIIEFVGKNWLFLSLSVGLLKGLASLSDNTDDDKIMTMIGNMLNGIKKT
jgi:hypothetical protein